MSSKERYGLYLITFIGLLYIILHVYQVYETHQINNSIKQSSKEYDSKIAAQQLINNALHESIKLRQSSPTTSVRIIDSLMQDAHTLEHISQCQLFDYKLRYLVEAKMITIAKEALSQYHAQCPYRSAESNMVNAVVNVAESDFDKAHEHLTIAKEKDSKYAWYLGNLYEITNKHAQAKKEYNYLLQEHRELGFMTKERIRIMENHPLREFQFLDDLKPHKFWNIKPPFYQGRL